MILRSFLALLCVAAAALFAAPASAQPTPCAPDDLRCRVERLEARLAALETSGAQAAAPRIVYQSPTQSVDTRRTCRTDCQAEAAALCTERGYAGGRAEDWDRPRSGPVVLTRAQCNRIQ